MLKKNIKEKETRKKERKKKVGTLYKKMERKKKAAACAEEIDWFVLVLTSSLGVTELGYFFSF